MPQLTDEQVAEEVRLIEAEDWPLWPVLPVKNLNRTYADRHYLGIITCRRGQQVERTVYIMNLTDLKPRAQLGPQLEGVPTEVFADTEAMVRAGWVGD